MRSLDLQPGEQAAVAWSFFYFFCLLSSYYIIRPVRDAMGVQAGVDQLQWLFTATFVVMLAAVPLFGYASARWPRGKLVPGLYLFFAISLCCFTALFQLRDEIIWAARAFYVWVSVYNLFVVSVFWSYMADTFSRAQGKRLFGLIAAGGSLGAVAGPTLAAWLAQTLSVSLLPLFAAVLLCGAMLAAIVLNSVQQAQTERGALQGSVWEGVQLVAGSRFLQGIALFIWLYTTLATFLYFQQAHLVADAFDDPADRTSLFASIDLLVNALTIAIQLFLTGRIMQRAGIGTTLAALPLLLAAGFATLTAAPTIAVLITVQVLRRAGNYGITRPAREVLFTSIGRAARYKAKNFIDTLVYRGGDALAGWLFAGLKAAGLGLGGIALLAVPLAVIWGWLGYRLGRAAETTETREARSNEKEPKTPRPEPSTTTRDAVGGHPGIAPVEPNGVGGRDRGRPSPQDSIQR